MFINPPKSPEIHCNRTVYSQMPRRWPMTEKVQSYEIPMAIWEKYCFVTEPGTVKAAEMIEA